MKIGILTNVQVLLRNLALFARIRNSRVLCRKLRTAGRWEHERIRTGIIDIATSIHRFLQNISLPSEYVICVMTIAGPDQSLQQVQ